MLLGLGAQVVLLVGAVLILFYLSRRLQAVIQQLGSLWLGDSERARRLFYFLVAPGIVVHELAHTLMAVVVGVRVFEVELFRPRESGQLGAVQHEQTDVFRGLLIGTAPVWAAGLIFWGMFTLFDVRLPDFGAGLQPLAVVVGSVGSLVELFHQAGFLRGVALFYVFFALGNSVLLSPQDLTDLKPFGFAVAGGAGLVALLSGVIDYSKMTFLAPVGAAAASGLNLLLFLILTVILADLLVVAPLVGLYTFLYRRAYPS